MAALTLDLFASAAYDLERAQYGVLGGLQHVQQAFAQNAVYPHLGELIALYETLRTVAEGTEGVRGAIPVRVKGIDLENEELVYEEPDLGDARLERVRELIDWALPRIQQAIEEGRTIYEFVEDSLHMETVGLLPPYVQEGYLLVVDRDVEAMHVVQYSVSIFTGSGEQYRSLRTTHIETIGMSVASPRDVKLRLASERCELPNPATYCFDSDLAFPFEPTVFPIAKRKLMRHLASEMGRA